MDRQARERDDRAGRARRIAIDLARRLLDEWGVRRVILFGSLAEGCFHERSDIDLAVEGLDPDELLDATVSLDREAGPFTIDLVPLERQPQGFRERIEKEGVVLP